MDQKAFQTFQCMRYFRKLLGILNSIEYHEFPRYHLTLWNGYLVSSPEKQVPSFPRFRKQLKDTIDYSPHGRRLITAFEDLHGIDGDQWEQGKQSAWLRYHEFCNYVELILDHCASPVSGDPPETVIVPDKKIPQFDFTQCCLVEFQPFPEGHWLFRDRASQGVCSLCLRKLFVVANDDAVLKRVYRRCIEKERRKVGPNLTADSEAQASDSIYIRPQHPQAHLFRDGDNWCTAKFAKAAYGITERDIDGAWHGDRIGAGILSDRRKADDVKRKPFVYRRSELLELSEVIQAKKNGGD